MRIFEEQEIASAHCKPKIWKRYVDDTSTSLEQGSVCSFLPHVHSQKSSTRFTTKTENDNDNKIAFLGTAVSRKPDAHFTNSVYRKPTHTGQYSAYG